MGLVKSVDVDIEARRVVVDLRLTSPGCIMVGFFTTELENLVREAIPEIRHVEVRFDHGFEWTPDLMSERVRRERAARFAAHGATQWRR
jgi:metal-sulfur cluster biosynthetic enzyme